MNNGSFLLRFAGVGVATPVIFRLVVAFRKELKFGERGNPGLSPPRATSTPNTWAVVIVMCAGSIYAQGQSAQAEPAVTMQQSTQAMQKRIDNLEAEVSELKAMVKQLQSSSVPKAAPDEKTNVDPPPTDQGSTLVKGEDRKTLDFFRDTTINLGLDTYYAYNFNHPVGRVNLLRAYDVLSSEFSLNQASVILEHAPDLSIGRRWGARLDLQFGQATDTLQGNPLNEPRPQIYRNIFQAYGTYIVPIGKGLTVDFGKWGSALGIEGNYSKDQMNYSRAFWFNFLPFYHMGVRATLPLNDRFAVNYWIVNGTNQVEATNGFKDELFGFTAKPARLVTWAFNYYLGQEHPDRTPATNCGPTPVQPGLCFTGISPAPNGRTHIFDSYVTWKANSKLTFAFEGDYLVQRLWKTAGPSMSSAPSHVDGGAAYVAYQFSPKVSLSSRAEYMSDRGGLFSGITQALKENTVTFDYKLTDGMLARYEWRRDFSNQPTFLSDVQGILRKQQNTATLGLVWWWGRKEGSW